MGANEGAAESGQFPAGMLNPGAGQVTNFNSGAWNYVQFNSTGGAYNSAVTAQVYASGMALTAAITWLVQPGLSRGFGVRGESRKDHPRSADGQRSDSKRAGASRPGFRGVVCKGNRKRGRPLAACVVDFLFSRRKFIGS
jgi:hypothetical protein